MGDASAFARRAGLQSLRHAHVMEQKLLKASKEAVDGGQVAEEAAGLAEADPDLSNISLKDPSKVTMTSLDSSCSILRSIDVATTL